MTFELTREYLDNIHQLIAEDNQKGVEAILEELHPADISEIYVNLDRDEARYLHLLLDEEKASDVLLELEENERKKFLRILPGDVIARQYIYNMDSDDAVDVLNELPEALKQEVLINIEDVEKASHILDLIDYPEDTAGGLMAKELIMVNENWSVSTSLREMRKQAKHVDEVYYVYVVDDMRILRGILSLKRMLLANDTAKIKNICDADVVSVRVNASSEEIISIIRKYDLVAVPVVDQIGRLLGRITIDDVVDVIHEEAREDYQLISGITQDISRSASIFNYTRARFPWLLIGLVGGILGAKIMGNFEDQLQMLPQMAFFIPLIMATGGNVGVQSSAIIVQSLANNTIGLESTWIKLLREFLIASINGILLGGLIFGASFLMNYPLVLSINVSLALFTVILIASLAGTFIPLALNKLKIDPALATGPFITTMNDILGVGTYFLIGRLLYGFF